MGGMEFQSTLFDAPAGIGFDRLERRTLTRGAWLDVHRDWLPEADDVFARLVQAVPWRAERREMYDRVVDVPRLVHTYLAGDALPLVILSAVCGAGVLFLLWRGHRRGTRPLAVGAVVAVIWGWGVAQHPYLLPQSPTISQGAGNNTTMVALLVVFVAAVLIVIPALVFLYTLAQRSMLETDAHAPPPQAPNSNG